MVFVRVAHHLLRAGAEQADSNPRPLEHNGSLPRDREQDHQVHKRHEHPDARKHDRPPVDPQGGENPHDKHSQDRANERENREEEPRNDSVCKQDAEDANRERPMSRCEHAKIKVVSDSPVHGFPLPYYECPNSQPPAQISRTAPAHALFPPSLRRGACPARRGRFVPWVAGTARAVRLPCTCLHGVRQSNTTVLLLLTRILSATCRWTARASTRRSRSRPLRTMSSMVSRWLVGTVSWAMMGPASRSSVT